MATEQGRTAIRIRVSILVGALLLTSPAWGTSSGLVLTPQQQALLGCGASYGTDCAVEGIGLLNQEASALLQSFPQVVAQPGTAWPPSGPAGIVFLPGALGPSGDLGVLRIMGSDVGYDPIIDGPFHPLIGQDFSSDRAALSWNYLMLLAATSAPREPGSIGVDEFDSTLPFRPDGCSFARPQLCGNVQGVYLPSAAIPEPGAALLFAGGFALVTTRLRRSLGI